MNSKISFEIVKRGGPLGAEYNGNVKEVNLVSWNGRSPKYDIREWQTDHEKCSKGVTLTESEAYTLANILTAMFGDSDKGGEENA